jgi:hypothetical protein
LNPEVSTTTTMKISGAGLNGVLRMTWLQDNLAHVLGHSDTDETPGTWAGLACPDHGLPLGTDVDNARLRRMCTTGEIADIIWETPDDLAAEHRRVFSAAIRAHHSGDWVAAEVLWHDVAAVWSHAWAALVQATRMLLGAAGAATTSLQPDPAFYPGTAGPLSRCRT